VGYVLGFDVGGTAVKAGCVDESGRIVRTVEAPVARGSAVDLIGQLESTVADLEASLQARATAIGVGLPGIVDQSDHRVRVAPALPQLNGYPVSEELGRRVGRPVAIENDANAAALAECWVGAGRGAQDVLLITLGTGIGGGLVLGGRLWAGKSGFAGEVGHIQADAQGITCACGSRGCVETLAGSRGWVRRANELLATRASALKGRELEPRTIVEAARQGDAVALEVVEGAAAALGVGLAAALDLLNLERIVVGGGVAAAGEFLLSRIAEQTRRRTFPHVFADCSFRLAELGNDAGVVGAARVALLEFDKAA
jgi:glucokinase